MRALVTKEIRMMLPAYAAALLLAILPVWLLPAQPNGPFVLFAFCFGVVLLSLSTFGREFSMGTFALLLAQPLARKRIWWTKTAVLACALGTALGALSLSWHASGLAEFGALPDRAVPLLLTLAAFAGGLWTTLLLRQVTAAFWMTVLIPSAIVALILIKGTYLAAGAALAVYALAGFLLAWWQFFRAQETGWTGGAIVLPSFIHEEAEVQRQGRSRRALAALFWKEVQIHQVLLVAMGGLFAVHMGTLVLRKSDSNVFANTGFMISMLCSLLWWVVPFIAGSASVAEERKLGTWEGHLCLPVSSQKQFAVKLLVVILVGGVLSATLFWFRAGVAHAMGGKAEIFEVDIPFSFQAWVEFSFAMSGIALVAFYASTLTRNILQAMAVAAVTLTLACSVMVAANGGIGLGRLLPWRGMLVNIIGLPTLVVIFLWLAYGNFRRLSEPWRMWRRNLLWLAGGMTFIAVLTTAIYNRAWDFLTPLEPPHGTARISTEKPVVLRTGGLLGGSIGMAAMLPDGRLWEQQLSYPTTDPIKLGTQTMSRHQWSDLGGDHFLEGSNWVDAVPFDQDTVGIKSDGSLWASTTIRERYNARTSRHPSTNAPGTMRQVGNETDWRSVAPGSFGFQFLLLKQDGTLWQKGAGGSPPIRLGTNSDWEQIVRVNGATLSWEGETVAYAWNKDGQAWAVTFAPKLSRLPLRDQAREFGAEAGLVRVENLDKTRWRSLTEFFQPWQAFHVGVREDGTLWMWGSQLPSQPRFNAIPARRMRQVGADSDWVAVVSGDLQTLVALKSDGSLWKWQWNWESREGRVWPGTKQPARLGTNHDWVGIVGTMGGVVSLAADGSLWFWHGSAADFAWGFNPGDNERLLAPPRKPVKLGILFGKEG